MSLKNIGTISRALSTLGGGARVSLEPAKKILAEMSVETAAATAATMGLTSAQTAQAMACAGATAEQIASTLAARGFTAAQTEAALASAHFEKEQVKSAIATATFSAAEGTATTATVAFGTAIKNAAVGLITFLTTNPVGWCILAAGAIAGVAVAVDVLTESFDEAVESANNARSEYESTTSELESLKSQLDETKSKITELKMQGSLSLTDQAELANLEAQNDQLQLQYDLKKRLAEMQGKEAADAAANVLSKEDFHKYEYDDYGNLISGTSGMNIIDYTRQQNDELQDLYSEREKLQQHQNELLKEGGIEPGGLFGFGKGENYDEYTNITNQLSALDDKERDLSKSISENTEIINTNYNSLFDSTGKVISGNEELAASCEDLFKEMASGSEVAANAETAISTILSKASFSGVKDNLIDVAESGSAALTSTIESSDELMAALDAAGVSAQDLTTYIMNLADPDSVKLENFTKTLRGIVAMSNDAAEAFDEFFSEKAPEDILKFQDYINSNGIDISQWNLQDVVYNFDIAVNGADEATNDVTALSDGLESAKENMASLSTALSESSSSTGLTSESLENIEKMFGSLNEYDPAKLFDNTANGIKINSEELRKLNAEYEKQQKQKYADTLSAMGDEYVELSNRINECTDAEERSKLLAERDALSSQIDDVKQLAVQYDGLTSAYNKWINAQSGPDYGDSYDNVVDNLENVKKLYDEGLVGKEEFRAAAQLMSNSDLSTASTDEVVAAYERGYEVMKKYFTDGQKGSQAFVEKLVEMGQAQKTYNEEAGRYEYTFDIDDKQIADELGISVDAVQLILDKLRAFGFEIDFESTNESIVSLNETLDGVSTKLADLKENSINANSALKELGITNFDFNFDSSNVDDLESQIKEASSLLDKFKTGAVDASGNVVFDIEADGYDEVIQIISTLITQKQLLSMPVVMTVNTSTLDSETSGAMKLLQDFQRESNNLELEIATGVDTSQTEAELERLRSEIENYDSENDTTIMATLDVDTSNIDTLGESIGNVDVELLANVGVNEENLNATIEKLNSGSYDGDATVTYTVNDDDVNDFLGSNHDADATVTYYVDKSYVNKFVNNLKNINRTVTYKIKTSGSTSQYTQLNGTAHVSGTAHASGTSNIDLRWRTKQDQDALTGELGTEILVDSRTGKWRTIGENGAEFNHIPKGSIVFNHEQTKDLLTKGYTNGRGHAYASGTALSSGSGGFYNTKNNSPVNTKNSSSVTKATKEVSKAAKAVSSAAKDTEDLVDFAEIKLSRLEAKTSDFISNAENSTKLSSILGNYQNAINNISKQIKTNQDAAGLYLAQAQKVGLSNSIISKIQNGTIEINKYGESTREKIEEYQKWYKKILDCQGAIADLAQQQKELAKTKLDSIADKYDIAINLSDSKTSTKDAELEYRSTAGYSNVSSKQKSIYQDQLKNEKYNYDKIKNAASAYYNELQKQMDAGLIEKYSDAWYEAQQQLQEYDQALYESQTAIEELNQKINSIEVSKVQYALNSINRWIDQLSGIIGLKTARGDNVTEKDYRDQIVANNDAINKEYELYKKYMKEQATYEYGSDKWEELAEKISDCKSNINDLLISNEELKDSIVSARWKEFDDLQAEADNSITEIEYLRDALNDVFVDSSGDLTESGVANIALIGQGMALQKQTIADYTEAIKKLDQELQNGNISQDEYNERLLEYRSVIRDAANAVSDYESELVDLYTEQLKKQNELLEKEIDLRVEALEKKEDYYDYDKKIKSKTKDIQSLEAQIAALSGVETSAGKAQLAQLQAQLQDAKDDYNDTVKEHERELIKNGYTDLKADSQDQLDATLEALESNSDAQKRVVSEMLGTITENYESAYGAINDLISTTGISISSSTQEMVNGLNSVITAAQTAQAAVSSASQTKASNTASSVDTGKIDTSKDSGGGSTQNAESAASSKENTSNATTKSSSAATAVISATSISLSKTSVSVKVGSTKTITVNPSPSNAAVSITWSTANSKIATVTNGTIKGISAGSTQITVKDSKSGKSATCKVTVTAASSTSTSNSSGASSSSSTAGMVSSIKGDLKQGSKGNDVKKLQTALNALGYTDNSGKKLSVDGQFGSITKQAVVKFQKANGLSQDGVVGKLTKAKFKAKGYARGTRYSTAGLHLLDENGIGTETIITPYGRIQQLEEGTRVFNDAQVDNLFLLSKIAPDLIANSVSNKSSNNSVSSSAMQAMMERHNITQHFDCLLKVEGNIAKDTFPGVKKMCEEAYAYVSKELSRDMHLAGYKRKHS